MATDEDGQESGSDFRAKFEANLAENKALREALQKATASSFKHVKPEDLKDLAPDQFATKAKEIEEARAAERETILREALTERYGPDVDLDSVLSKGNAAPVAHTNDSAADRIASLGQLGGTPTQGFHGDVGQGESRIAAALAADSQRR